MRVRHSPAHKRVFRTPNKRPFFLLHLGGTVRSRENGRGISRSVHPDVSVVRRGAKYPLRLMFGQPRNYFCCRWQKEGRWDARNTRAGKQAGRQGPAKAKNARDSSGQQVLYTRLSGARRIAENRPEVPGVTREPSTFFLSIFVSLSLPPSCARRYAVQSR